MYKGSVHRRINVSETAPQRPSQSLELCQRSRASPAPLRRTRACTRPHKTGCQNSVPNLRSLGSSPCFAADAAWRDTGAKQARHRVLPKSRLIRANRQALSRVSEAVPPQRPVGQPGGGPACFPFCYATLPTLRSLEVAGGGVGIKGHKRGWLSRTQSVLLRSA